MGVAVLSEESGTSGTADSAVTVVIDPIDGSTNASRGLPWWSTTLCAVDAAGPWVGLVHDHASGTRYWAVRGKGAYKAVIDAGTRSAPMWSARRCDDRRRRSWPAQ